MKKLFGVVLFVLMLGCAARPGLADHEQHPEGFDPPLEKIIVAAKPDPANPHDKATLTCIRYPGFMVKQTDTGQKGASRLAIVPLPNPAKNVRCREEAIPHEFVLDGERAWNGYFRGVKGQYVFFDGDDGYEGGMVFAVFDATTGTRVFVDAISGTFTTILTSPSRLGLSYRRVYRTACSLYADAPRCWPAVKKDTGLNDAGRLGCKARYQQELSSELARRSGAVSPKQITTETLEDPSVLDYDVHVLLKNNAASRGLDPGPVDCHPAE